MNITFFDLIIRYFCLLVVSVSSIFGTLKIEKITIGINNVDRVKTSSVVNTIVNYDTITIYNENVPSGVVNVLSEGKNGIVYVDNSGNVFKTIQEKKDRIVEIGIGVAGKYTGILTGYGPDCATCDGRGYVYCPTNTGKYISLTKDGIIYNDTDFGNVRILAADQREFPCGTIIEVTNSDMSEPLIGIVLDTGASMKNAYNNGIIHLDLAFATQQNLNFSTNKNTTFNVRRWGW